MTSSTRDPSASANRLISKFVASAPKSVVLSTLHHLSSPHAADSQPLLSSLALPLYTEITEASWFCWNSKLVANVIALLYKQGQIGDAEGLILVTRSTKCPKERDLVQFYCNLMEFVTKLKSENGLSSTYARLNEMLSSSSSVYVRRRAYESLVGGLCVMDQPHEAKNLIAEMRQRGIKPSAFEFRSVVEAYGRLGLFEEMLQTVAEMQDSGFALDTVTSNMVLSSYGRHDELSQMYFWLQWMKDSGVRFSVRTYNSVLNSCPTVMSLLQDLKTAPVTLTELLAQLEGNEAKLVKELSASPFVEGMLTWDSFGSKLDLHGMHLGTSYLVFLQWMEELRRRFTSGQHKIPADITVVCGSGKHSSVRGESPVKALVRKIMLRARSPLRIDRKNIGCFIAKGKAVKEWLC
ncbi:hypothetical protein Cgig2_021561 [Carnegiea gigantea]|uniref:Smr domain-containing protein n=1 Tax=Carnegiea gigantea TaxID=171969 RepID=A0A9Q1KA22_9CARY|nr:hypothetical protein Cgig2_021561 [Carnegiea gigantea]